MLEQSHRRLIVQSVWAVCLAFCCQAVGSSADEVSSKTGQVRESTYLAHQILSRDGLGPLVDANARNNLAARIQRVLERVRQAYPNQTEAVAAQQDYLLGRLILKLHPEFFQSVVGSVELWEKHALISSPDLKFNDLCFELGLRSIEVLGSNTLLARFSELANLEYARLRFNEIPGVEFAEPDAFLMDGSDVLLSETEGKWFAIVKKAWGDCQSGCLYKEHHFFVIDDNSVELIEPEQAGAMSEFSILVREQS